MSTDRARWRLGSRLRVSSSFASAATCYVNFAATGSNDGTTWENAYTDLQSALADGPACAQIWIARGTYKPTATTDRTISFNIKPFVAVYGGFAGGELFIGNRILPGNPTILSGDIGVAGNNSDNSYHVVVMDGTTASGVISLGNVLDGMTISDGNANGPGANDARGGGLYCDGHGAGHVCGPDLSRLIFENNLALYGAAIYNDGSTGGTSSPHLFDVIVRGNRASQGPGGGMYNNGGNGGTSSPLIDGVTFTGNSGIDGGAIFNRGSGGGHSNPIVRNSTFYANTAYTGGAMSNNGDSSGHASPVLRYVTFYKNKATSGYGGAIWNYAPTGDAAPDLSGVIFWADEATVAPIEMNTESLTTPTIEYSITPECPPAAVGCINADPLLGELQDNGGFAPTLRPEIGSPAIDNGNAGNCTGFDERGINRPQGAKCDIGAVELKPSERKICYVNGAAGAANNGLSWATAYVKLNNALADATCSEVWVAQGIYRPTTDSNRSASFALQPGQAVYGGFAGNETTRGQRDPASHVTTLSGEIGNTPNVQDNVYHVVLVDAAAAAINVAGNTVLDGFTISGGYAEGTNLQRYGGGLLCNGQGNHGCNPTLSNLIFSSNHAVFGGGLANYGTAGVASPTVKHVTFTNNEASDRGGAVMNFGNSGVSGPELTRLIFENNSATFGGAIYNDGSSGGVSSPNVREVIVRDNQASNQGGGMYNNGGDGTSNPLIDQVTFTGNSAGEGGAIYNFGVLGNSSPTVRNSTFYANTAYSGGAMFNLGDGYGHASPILRYATFHRNKATGGKGGAIRNFSSTGDAAPNLSGVIFWADESTIAPIEMYTDSPTTPSIEYSITPECPPAAVGCINADPLLGQLQDNGGFAPTLRPQIGSPAIDNGDAVNCPSFDERGIKRPQGANCDIGAVERLAAEDYIFNNGFDF
jgi:predicted outer membrane repeat protein